MPHLQIGLKLKILEGGVWIRRKQTDKEKGEKSWLVPGGGGEGTDFIGLWCNVRTLAYKPFKMTEKKGDLLRNIRTSLKKIEFPK